jgi:hypothetical protein
MKRSKLSRSMALSSGVASLLAVASAHADITLEEKVQVEGVGIMAMANMSGTTTTAISGDRARMDSDIQMQSRLVRMFARDAGQMTEIIRLDQDKIYDLNVRKKQYSEVSLADKRAELTKAMGQAKEAQEKQPAPTGMDESQCEWSDPKVDVKKTGQKATIAGFDAEQTTIVASQSCKDKKTGAVCDVAITLDQWLAPKFDAGTEHQKFYQAYAQKMGFAGTKDASQRAEQLFGRYEGIWKEVAGQMVNVKGYPVRSSFSLGFGGPQCQTAEEAKQANATLPPAGPSMGSIAQATGEVAAEEAARKSGASAFGGVAGQLGGKIAGSLFNRRKKAEVEEAAQQDAETVAKSATVSNGMITPLRITSELVSVKKDSVSSSSFDVPADFKKVANPHQ